MSDKPNNRRSGMPVGEASQRFTQMISQDIAVVTKASMQDGEIERLLAAFEADAQFNEHGIAFWSARAIARLLEYSDYRNFLNIVEKAKTACLSAGQPFQDHFVDVTEMIELGKGATREIDDLQLSRYACYLITQNGDPRKKPVAFGQTYFAIQTRRQELSDQGAAAPVSEDEKRVFLRNQIKEHNIKLSGAAKDAGVVTPQEFAIFHSKGYQGLYGKTVPEIRRYKGLPTSADILDRMGSTELAANFFRVTQTEEKLRKDAIRGINNAYTTHYAVGRQVRDAMLKISGIAPEDLSVADSIKNAEKRIKSETTVPRELVPAVKAEPTNDSKPINLRKDLWKFALLIMALRVDGVISTADLIAELPRYIHIAEDSQTGPTDDNDTNLSEIVSNLKSHKTSKTNFINQGYAEDMKGGFRITPKGRDFVKSYFTK